MNKLLQHIIDAGDVDHKILPGLQKMQKAGIVMFKPPVNDKPVYDNIPNPAVVRSQMAKDAAAKQALAKRAADQAAMDRHGYLRQAPEPRSMASKAWAVATNPMTALAYKVQGRDIPDNFELGKKNSLDIAANIVNPFFYMNEAKEFGKGVGNIAYKGVTDPFSLSGMDFLNTGMHALGAMPFAAEAVQGTKLLSQGLRGATQAYKGTAGMTSGLGRIKNAANAGAISLGRVKGDVYGHSYFNIPPDEVAKMMAQEMASLPKGAYSFDGNMSKNSAPLFWTQAARNPKGFTAVNPGETQLLNWSGGLGRRINNALPENIESIMPAAPKYAQDLQNRVDLLRKIGDPQSLKKAAQLEKEGIGSYIIKDMPNAAISDPNIRKSFGDFLNTYKTTLDNPIIEVNRKTGLNFPMTNIIDKNIGKWTNEFYEQPSIYMVKGNPLSRVPKIVGDYAGQRAKAFFGRNRDYENPRIPFILTNAAYNAGMNIAGQNQQRYGGENNMFKVFAQEGVEYKGPSIVDYLATKGYSGKKAFRKELADKYGIEGYDFSAAKNTELLNRLRESDELLRQYDQTMAPVPVERMMEMEQQARAARQAAAQRPVNPAPVYNFSPEFQNMRIPQTKINTSLQPKVIFDGKFSLKPKMVIPMPFGFNKTTPAPEVSNTEITDPVRNVPSRPKLNLPQYNPFARPEARPELGPFISERYNDVQEVDIPTEQETPEFLFNSQKLFNSFNRPEQKPLLPVVLPAKKPVVKTEKYTKPEAEELPWYEEAANAVTSTLKGFYDDFAESVNNSPYDFRQVNFGTGMSADGAKEMTREVTRKGLGLFSPDLAEKYNNWLNRQQAIQNMDKDPVSKIVVPDFDYAPMYITGDTIPDSERQYHLAESMDLNALKFGVRNRGDLTPLDTEAASITAFHPFVDAKLYFTQIADDPANATYLGITPDGQVQVGGRKDVENKDVKITRVFSNKVVDFVRDPTGGIKKVPAGAKVNKNAFSPAVTVIGDDGKQKEGKLNLVVPQGTKADDAFGVATGGRFIFQTPDGQSRLVSGSLNNIEQEFKRIKGNNPYVTVISLDNGSFSRGLRTRDKRLTATDLRSYDNLNTGGGNFAYLLPNQQTSRPLAKFDEFEKEATKRLQALYPGKKVSVEYQDTGLYNQLGGRDIQTQADIQKKGNSQTGVSLHNFNAARDYVLYVDGKPINGDEKNKAGNDIYKEVLWKAADKTGVYHIDPWDVGHIGLAKEGQKTAFDELKAKYPEIFTDPNFVKSLEFINKNKNNPNYQEYYELLNNIQKFTGAPRTTEFMKRSGTAKKAYGGPVDLPKAQWGSFVNPTTIAGMAIIAEKAKEFFGFNEPKIVRTPASAPKRLSIRDPRKVMMTSGKPLRPNSDLVSGDYDSEHLGNLMTEAKRRKMSYNDMMNLAAMGFQETKWGKTDPNIGHTMDIFGDDPNPDAYENFINAYDAKMKDADRLKIKDEATRLQVYNGLGKVFPSTEADYHGFKMKKIYGVEVPKGGIDLRKNPLYGKQVIDIRDNVLKRNPEFMRYMDSTYRAPRPIPKEEDFANGGLFKMQKAGQNNLPQRVSINDPRYAELYKNRQVGSFYDDAFSLPDLDEVTVTGKDERLKEGMSQGSSKFLQGLAGVMGSPQTGLMEVITGKQQTPSEAWGFDTKGKSWYNPKSISNFVMDSALDPMNALGVGLIDDVTRGAVRAGAKQAARRSGNYLTTKTPLKNAYKYNPLALKDEDVEILQRWDFDNQRNISLQSGVVPDEYTGRWYGSNWDNENLQKVSTSVPNYMQIRPGSGQIKTAVVRKGSADLPEEMTKPGFRSFYSQPATERILPKDATFTSKRVDINPFDSPNDAVDYDETAFVNAWRDSRNLANEALPKPNWLTGYNSNVNRNVTNEILDNASNYLTTKTPLRNAYKINPWAFKPQEGMMYRGLGQEGYDDALKSGVFRPKQYNYPEKRSFAERVQLPKQFGPTFYAPAKKFKVVSNYGDGYIAEVPFEGNLFNKRYGNKDWSWSTPKQIPINEGRLLQKDWLRGYTPVKKTGGAVDLPKMQIRGEVNLPGSQTISINDPRYPSVKEMGGPILDPRGQWAHPGKITRIPGSDITMQGVPYPVYGVGSNGQEQMMYPGQEYNFGGASYVDEYPMMVSGGYTVTRSNDRKGKTHKVTGPDGTVKYFGDSKLGQHPKDPERKAAFYARHKKNLAGNPFFRAFARKTWEDGGQTDYMQGGGLWDTDKVGYLDSTVNANRNLEFIRRAIENDGLSIPTPKGAPGYGKGMTSSHLMTFDPKSRRSYPELVNMNGTLKYLTGDDAYNYAEDTGEYIQFPTAKQADYFSQNYKKSNYVKVGKQPLEKKHGIKVTYKK